MSQISKKPFLTVMAALAVIIPVAFGGSAAFASDIPSDELVSSGTIEPSAEPQTAPAAGETTTEQAAPQESAPAPAEPIVATAEPEPVATQQSAPAVPVVVEDTQPAPPEELVVVVDGPESTVNLESKTHPTTPPTPECVNDKGGSWTINWATGLGSVTLVGDHKAKPGDKVCDPIALRPTNWEFLDVSSLWEQGNAQTNDTVADTIGTTTFQIPGWPSDCSQGDVYAARFSNGGFDALVLPEILKGAGNPFEPTFLHDVLKGSGNAYFATSAEGCNVPIPEKVTGTATFEVLSCTPGSKNQAVADVVPGGIWSISDTKGLTQDLAAIGAGYTGGLPDGLSYGAEYTLSLRDGDASDLFDVTPWKSSSWTPIESVDCYTIDAAYLVVSTEATCTEPSKVEFSIYNATWDEEADLTVGDHSRSATALANHRFHSQSLPEGTTTATAFYTIDAALGYQSTDVNAPCYVAPPTPPKTDTPPTVPVANVQHPLPPVLASTGIEALRTVALALSLLLAGAVAAVINAIRRHRKAAAQQ